MRITRKRLKLNELRQRWPIGKKLFLFAVVLALALILPGLAYTADLPLEGRKTLFIFTLAVGLWMTDAIPPFATALLIVGFQVFFLGVDQKMASDLALEKYTRAWASPVIWLLMGGFFISLALSQTGIDRQVFKKFSRWFGAKTHTFLFATMTLAALLSMFMSNTATTALMLGILGPHLSHVDQSPAIRKSFLIGIPAAASIGGMTTLIGSTPNAIAYSFLRAQGFSFGFLDWLMFGVPLLLILLPTSWFLTCRIFKLPNISFRFPLETECLEGKVERSHRARDKNIVLLTFFLTVFLWATAPFHALSVSVVSFIPIVVFSVTGVIKSEDIRLIPWDTLLLIMGGMSLGESVIESGLAQFFLSYLTNLPANNFLLLLVFAYVSVLFSTFMSNTAAAAILIPMGSLLVKDSTLEIALVIALSSSAATALPVSTPPNAVAYASGQVASKDFAYLGIMIGLIAPPLIALVVSLLG